MFTSSDPVTAMKKSVSLARACRRASASLPSSLTTRQSRPEDSRCAVSVLFSMSTTSWCSCRRSFTIWMPTVPPPSTTTFTGHGSTPGPAWHGLTHSASGGGRDPSLRPAAYPSRRSGIEAQVGVQVHVCTEASRTAFPGPPGRSHSVLPGRHPRRATGRRLLRAPPAGPDSSARPGPWGPGPGSARRPRGPDRDGAPHRNGAHARIAPGDRPE